jgi:competence protein ComEC
MLLFWSLLGCLALCYFLTISVEIPKQIIGQVIVIHEEEGQYTTRYSLLYHKHIYHIHASHDEFEVGDRLYIEGSITLYPHQTMPKGYDAYHEFRSQGIDGHITSYHIMHKEKGFSLWTLRARCKDLIDQRTSSSFVMAMLFGQRLSDEEKNVYDELGLGYLLSVSGIHLFACALMLRKGFYAFNIPVKVQTLMIISFYGMMVYFHRFDLGILRLFIMEIALWVNKKYDLKKSSFELFQVVMFLMLLLRIESLMSTSILILYLILSSFYLLEPLYRGYNPILKRYVMSAMVILILLPFTGRVHMIALCVIPFFGIFLAMSLMIFSWLVVIFPPIHSVFLFFTDSLNLMLTWMSHRALTLYLGRLDPLLIILYFLFVLMILLSKRYTFKTFYSIAIILLFIVPSWIYRQTTSITFLDVGQGDATILTSKGCIAVMDAYDHVYDYLTRHGVDSIDYLILTHSDLDHIQEASTLISRLHVKHVILSSSDQNYPAYSLRPRIVKAGDHVRCGDVLIDILAPLGQAQSSNDASIVMQMTLHHTTFLLMGDAESKTEASLIETYGHLLKSDVLKVGHHGSKTSSSTLFLHYVKPSRAIISVGRRNRYGFPHDEVIHRLKEIHAIIDRTDLQGTIRYFPTKKKHNWQYSLPF